ncbi:MAG: VWA domain-containing protein [Terracidiphilus sp.]|nr:VWA domain-containing protein [Terracidiphilus sp.]
MRRLILLGLIATMALPAAGARRVTVAQLEKSLAADLGAHRADTDVAHRLGDFELSERLTGATLERLAKNLAFGPRAALALELLADQSAFLDPPPAELPATAAPAAADEERMMDLARGYVIETVPRLPNFFVTRTTNRFDNSPQVLRQGEWPVRAGLHRVGTKVEEETFRDGKEVLDTQPAAEKPSTGAQPAQPDLGLFSFGEFGPVLAKTLTDMSKGKVTWSHWEQTPAGLAAVYSYSVPMAASHFEVQYCCMSEDAPSQRRPLGYGGGNRAGTTTVPVARAPANARLFHETPGYHGNLFVDPSTGAVLRVTLEAELKPDDPITRAAIAVEYSPVQLGERTYICPARSLAFSVEQAPARAGNPGGGTIAEMNQESAAWGSQIARSDHAPIVLVNESTFTHYHRLGSTVRLVADTPESSAPASGQPPAQDVSPVSTVPAIALPSASAASGASAPAAPTAEAASSPPAPAPPELATAAPAPPPEPVVPEITLSAANGVPDQPANPAEPLASDFQLKLSSRLVDVGIVAWDKKGHPVRDLKAEDFEIYDNGRKQDLRFFSEFASDAPTPPATDAPGGRSFSNRAPDSTTVAAPADAGATILLIDEAHIAWPDMAHARQEILKFVATLGPNERVGIYTMTALGFRVLEEITTDHAALTARLNKWMPTAQSAALAQEEETRNRQSFNEVHSTADLNSVNGNQVEVPDAQQTVDPILRTMGSNPARASLIILGQVARHLSAVTGHKNLVWVSSDNVFADWQSNQVAIDKTPKQVDSFAQHAQEAMNDAHVAVYPMDVSQIETSAISADIRTRNVELNQAASDTASLNGGSVANSLAPGRNSAEMLQDMHPIQGPIRMVADSTGGRIIRRAGDLAAALAGVVEDGHATYLVSFTPQGPADDQYHNIAVKLTGQHKGLTLRYRTGYLYAKEPASLAARFKDAVWKPLDASEIAVTAAASPMNAGANLKITIVAADLGLQQRAGRWMDRLDIFFIQRDDAGLKAQVEGQTLGLRLRPGTYQNLLAAGVPFEHFVRLGAGTASLRIVVVDENSGRMGSVTIPAAALEAAK